MPDTSPWFPTAVVDAQKLAAGNPATRGQYTTRAELFDHSTNTAWPLRILSGQVTRTLDQSPMSAASVIVPAQPLDEGAPGTAQPYGTSLFLYAGWPGAELLIFSGPVIDTQISRPSHTITINAVDIFHYLNQFQYSAHNGLANNSAFAANNSAKAAIQWVLEDVHATATPIAGANGPYKHLRGADLIWQAPFTGDAWSVDADTALDGKTAGALIDEACLPSALDAFAVPGRVNPADFNMGAIVTRSNPSIGLPAAVFTQSVIVDRAVSYQSRYNAVRVDFECKKPAVTTGARWVDGNWIRPGTGPDTARYDGLSYHQITIQKGSKWFDQFDYTGGFLTPTPTLQAWANAEAENVAARVAGQYRRSATIRALPTPWLWPGDTASVRIDGADDLELVRSVTLPLTPGEPMTVTSYAP